MRMDSSARTRTSLVGLIVLALIFVGLSSFAYTALSSENDGTERGREGNENSYIASENGLSGQVVDSEKGKPIAGAEVTLTQEVRPPMPGRERDHPEREDKDPREGTRCGEREECEDQERPGNNRENDMNRDDRENKDSESKDPEGRRTRRPVPDDTPGPGQNRLTTRTNERGFFNFPNVRRGEYLLEVRANERIIYSKLVKFSGSETRPLKIVVRLVTCNDAGKMANSRPYYEPDHKLHLHATPVDGDGDGFADDVIVYASTGNNQPAGGAMIYIDGVYTGSTSYEGWIMSLDYEPGHHKVEGLYHQTEGCTKFRIHEHWIPPEPQPGEGHLKGVVYSLDNEPVGGAKVEISGTFLYHNTAEGEWKFDEDRPHYYHSTTTNRHGEFGFERVPEGEYILSVFTEGYREYREEVYIEGDETTHIRILLEPMGHPEEKGHLTGIVYSGDTALGGVVLELTDHRYHASYTTEDDGEFVFRGIPEGEYILYAFAEGYMEYKDEVFIEGDETTHIRILLEPIEPREEPGALVGHVFNEKEEPVEHAKIIAYHEEMDIVYDAESNAYGHFKMGQMVPGEYMVRVEAEGYKELTMKVEIFPDKVTEVTL